MTAYRIIDWINQHGIVNTFLCGIRLWKKAHFFAIKGTLLTGGGSPVTHEHEIF
jgi:hypothetical protein